MKKVIAAFVLAVLGLLVSPGAAGAQVAKVTVCSTSGWDHSDSVGYNTPVEASQYTADGLVLDLTGPRSGGKQSGYVELASAVKLTTVNQNDVLITYVAESGPSPAYQLRAHPNGDATWAGHLVYEGGKWWATRPQEWPLVPTASMALGGAALSDYKTAYPLTTISHVGFSLGSGVTGKGVLKNMTFQGTHWVFGLCPTPTTDPTTPTSPTSPTTDPTSPTETTDPTTPTSPEETTPPVTTTSPTDTQPIVVVPTTTSTSKPVLVDVGYERTDLANTGASGVVKFLLTALGLLAGGALILLLMRHRKRPKPDYDKDPDTL